MSVTVEERPEVLTVLEAARLMRVSRQTVYRLIQEGKLPGVVRIGPFAIRINRRALEAYLKGEGSLGAQPGDTP